MERPCRRARQRPAGVAHHYHVAFLPHQRRGQSGQDVQVYGGHHRVRCQFGMHPPRTTHSAATNPTPNCKTNFKHVLPMSNHASFPPFTPFRPLSLSYSLPPSPSQPWHRHLLWSAEWLPARCARAWWGGGGHTHTHTHTAAAAPVDRWRRASDALVDDDDDE